MDSDTRSSIHHTKLRSGKTKVIAGCTVSSGKITKNSHIVVLRNEVIVKESKISSLKSFDKEVKEILNGHDCGICLEDFYDFEEQDVIEAYLILEEKRKID